MQRHAEGRASRDLRLDADLATIEHARQGAQRVYLGTIEHGVILRRTNAAANVWASLTPYQRWIWLTEYIPLLMPRERKRTYRGA